MKLGKLYSMKKDFDQAQNMFKLAINIAKNENDCSRLIDGLLEQGYAYKKQKCITESIASLKKAEKIAHENCLNRQEKAVVELLADLAKEGHLSDFEAYTARIYELDKAFREHKEGVFNA
ncbi:hypothetical protein [Mechercharimyces sp. CAU 1602]|uniref:hypothetical protein n=1 Tax=Mechercharimyces sp. CAU 1602 TaxID=2973933 RepID=UPI0021628507|nr:hypothetical protein [Mechercharimyces sp. CAU 1602]MCS1350282.1 hypothetical protein [Mechercharimyces sp. CAU 1602]